MSQREKSFREGHEVAVLKSMKVGPKIIAGYVVGALAMAIITFMLLNNMNGLTNKFDFLVHLGHKFDFTTLRC